MRIDISEKYQLFKPEEAEKLVNELNSTEDTCGWTYKASHCPKKNGLSYIEIYDEDNVLVGKL